MPEKLRWDGTVNFGTIGTVVQLVALLVAIVVAWGQFDKRATVLELQMSLVEEQQKAASAAIVDSNQRTERIERYLISKDPKYVEQFGLPDGKDGPSQ